MAESKRKKILRAEPGAAVFRTAYPEVPPRVECTLTPFGQKFVRVLDGVKELQRERSSRGVAAP